MPGGGRKGGNSKEHAACSGDARGRTSNTPCGTCFLTRAHTALCHAGLSLGVQQPRGHAAGESPSCQGSPGMEDEEPHSASLGMEERSSGPAPQGWRMRSSISLRHRGAPEAREVPAGLHTLPAPGAPTLCQRFRLPWLAQVLPPRVPAPLHCPGRRYSTAAQPLAPPLSWGSQNPSPLSLSPPS